MGALGRVVVGLPLGSGLVVAAPAARADAHPIEVAACDLGADALFVTGLAHLDPRSAGATLLVASGAVYLVGAPIVHVAHGDGLVAVELVDPLVLTPDDDDRGLTMPLLGGTF